MSLAVVIDLKLKKPHPKNLNRLCVRFSNIIRDYVRFWFGEFQVEFKLIHHEEKRLVFRSDNIGYAFDDMGKFDKFINTVLYEHPIVSSWCEAQAYCFNFYSGETWTAWSINDKYRYVTIKDQKDMPFKPTNSELDQLVAMNWLKDHLSFA